MLSDVPRQSMPTPLDSSDVVPVPATLSPTQRAKSALREYAEVFAFALCVAVLIRSVAVQAFQIPSGSMLPTLQVGDHILVNKFLYGIRLPFAATRIVPLSEPRRGDVVVFAYPVDPSKDFIKRVVGVAGDVVEIRDKHVYINGQAWDDPHAYFADGPALVRANSTRDNFGPVTVPAGHVFVLGDNRDRSYDSRFWGFVSLQEIEGKAFFIYWSWGSGDRWVRWDRVGHVIE